MLYTFGTCLRPFVGTSNVSSLPQLSSRSNETRLAGWVAEEVQVRPSHARHAPTHAPTHAVVNSHSSTAGATQEIAWQARQATESMQSNPTDDSNRRSQDQGQPPTLHPPFTHTSSPLLSHLQQLFFLPAFHPNSLLTCGITTTSRFSCHPQKNKSKRQRNRLYQSSKRVID